MILWMGGNGWSVESKGRGDGVAIYDVCENLAIGANDDYLSSVLKEPICRRG